MPGPTAERNRKFAAEHRTALLHNKLMDPLRSDVISGLDAETYAREVSNDKLAQYNAALKRRGSLESGLTLRCCGLQYRMGVLGGRCDFPTRRSVLADPQSAVPASFATSDGAG
jgi:hypothetical protein